GRGDGLGAVGGVVEHLDLVAAGGVFHRAYGADEPLDDVGLVVDGKLGGDHRELLHASAGVEPPQPAAVVHHLAPVVAQEDVEQPVAVDSVGEEADGRDGVQAEGEVEDRVGQHAGCSRREGGRAQAYASARGKI